MSKDNKMEKIEGSELQVGYCDACGQGKQFQTSGGVKQDLLNEWATDECSCAAGADRRKLKRSRERAEANIEKLFGEKFPETAEVLKVALPHIILDRIDSITIKTGYDVDAKLSITAKSKVKVEKKMSNKVSLSE